MTDGANTALTTLLELFVLRGLPAQAPLAAEMDPAHNAPRAQTIKGNALVAAHFGQFPGMFHPQTFNLLQASLNMNTEASLISTMAFVVCKEFETARFIDAKSKQIMVNSFCFTSWISDPVNYYGKLPADLRRVLRPDDEHDEPMNDDDARNFMFNSSAQSRSLLSPPGSRHASKSCMTLRVNCDIPQRGVG